MLKSWYSQMGARNLGRLFAWLAALAAASGASASASPGPKPALKDRIEAVQPELNELLKALRNRAAPAKPTRVAKKWLNYEPWKNIWSNTGPNWNDWKNYSPWKNWGNAGPQ